MLKKIALFFYSIYGFIVFLALMFILLPFFTIGFIQSPPKGSQTVMFLARIWSRLFFLFTNIRAQIRHDFTPDPKQPYIIVSNHISYIDIPLLLIATSGRKMRVLAKAEMAKIPIFGWIYARGAVLVDRSNPEAREESVKKLILLLNRGISVFICPEGTFNLTHAPLKFFYDGAFKIAIETQKPILPIVFPDTYDRLNYKSIFSLNPGKCRAYILPPTFTEGMEEEDIDALKEKIFRQMESKLVDLQASWIKAN